MNTINNYLANAVRRSSQLLTALVAIAVMILTSGCESTGVFGGKNEAKEWRKTLNAKGWTFLPRPDTLTAPGLIIRVDSRGVAYHAYDLSKSIATTNGLISEPTITSSKNLNFDGMVSLIFSEVSSPHLTNLLQWTNYFSFEASNAVQHLTFDQDVDRVLTPQLLRTITERRPNDQYYIVRGSRSATGIDTTFEKAFVLRIGVEATITNIASEASMNLTRSSQNSMVLNKTFSQPHYYKVLLEPIKRVKASLAGTPEWARSKQFQPLSHITTVNAAPE